MIDKVLNEYVKVYSFNNIYVKHFRRWVIYPAIIFICLLINGLIVLAYFYNSAFLSMIVSVPVFLIIPVFVIEKKFILNKGYQCKDTNELKRRLNPIFEYNLKKINIDLNSKVQLEYLLKIIERNLTDIKPNVYLRGGLFITIIAPLWAAYCNKLFSMVKNESNATNLFFLMISILAILFLLVYGFKLSIYDDIKYSKYNRLKLIHILVEEIYIQKLGFQTDNS